MQSSYQGNRTSFSRINAGRAGLRKKSDPDPTFEKNSDPDPTFDKNPDLDLKSDLSGG